MNNVVPIIISSEIEYFQNKLPFHPKINKIYLKKRLIDVEYNINYYSNFLYL